MSLMANRMHFPHCARFPGTRNKSGRREVSQNCEDKAGKEFSISGGVQMRFHVTTRILALVAVLTLFIPSGLMAQSLTQGAISGTVVDASNAVLPNATIKLKSRDKGFTREAVANGQGSFQFPLVDAGNYTVEVAAQGFRSFNANVAVNVGQVTNVNAKLEIGATGVTVEVSGVAPLMETEAADMSTSFDQNMVQNLPNGGNDLTALAYTAPGVVMNTGGMYGNFNANGLPATSNVFTVDGENQMDPFLNLNNSGPTNLMLGKNSIDEATVVTNAYSGQYGQQAGAQVNLVSKGGTNDWHGNANYEWTGRYLDANNWFNGGILGTPQPAPFANNNQWAASFGGPIKRDRAFFFLDTEGIRYIVPSTQPVYTPTTAFLTDTLNNLQVVGASQNTITSYQNAAKIWEAAPNFGSGTPIAGSCVDPLTGNPVGTGVGESAGCFQQYESSPAVPAKETLLIGRFDVNLTQKDRAFFRFDIDSGTQATYADPINPSAFSAASFQPQYTGSLVWNHTFGLTATNQFVAAASYYRATFDENTNGSTSPFPYSLYVGASVPHDNLLALPGLTGLNADNFTFPEGRDVTQYQFVDDFAKTIGRHNIKVGVNFRRYDITNYDASVEKTPLVFADTADFYAGQADLYIQSDPSRQSAPMNTGGIGVYVQDEWAARPSLKLTAALRIEHNLNPTCDVNCFTMPTASFSQLVTQGVNTPYDQALNFGRNTAFNSVDSVNWAPRFGFTWSPRGSSKTVLSGGIGFFYDAFPAFITDSFVNVPYLVGVTLESTLFTGNPLSLPVYWGDSNGAATTVSNTANVIRNGNGATPSITNGLTYNELIDAGGAPPNITGFPSKLRTPQYQEWNIQVQQQLDNKSRLTLAYVGNHGIHEPYPNSTLNASSSDGITGYPTTNPDPRFGTFTEWNSGALSNYNGLTVGYTRRATAGFVVNANFTWAHALDEISNGSLLGYSVSSLQGQINPLNFRANNYGNADYDIRHSFNANYVWTEPFHSSNRVVNGILSGWIASENFSVRSGLPFSITDGTVTTNEGGTAIPAEVLGPAQQSCVNGFSACFNSNAVASAGSLGFFPNQTRNQYRGPDYFGSDVTIGKNFSVKERVKVGIGLNVYDIFNHPNFQNPSSAYNGAGCSTIASPGTQPGCGNITNSAAPPTGPYGAFFAGLPSGRMGQLTAKITF
jgi:hypothetical protein